MSWGRYALLGACLSSPALAQPAPGELRLPVPAGCISSPFGPRNVTGPRAAPVHTGIDLPAPAGAWVVAAAAGEVTVRRRGSLGLEIDIRHNTYLTRYAHLGTVAPSLANGKRSVAAGERIGRIGRTGVTYGTHLHFELHVNGVPVDPAPFVALQHCR
jgi:murein DD-endopeptidase MepM/ murein hydrolase activator NlpD